MVTSAEEIADVIERYVREQFRVREGDSYFARDAHLYDSGFVDSTGVVELIAFVETTFGVKLQDEHIFSDAFTTIDGISAVVHECLAAEVAAGGPGPPARSTRCPSAEMGQVRAFARQDVPQVAELHRTVFGPQGPAAPDAEAYQRYFSSVFLENPWRDSEVPSRVYQEDDGGISGFLGVVPRRMSMDGRPVRAAICSQFVVHPEKRGLVGLRLLKAVFEGPQDVSISDEANDATRAIWEARGGATAFLHSFRWLRPLRPGRLAESWLRERQWPAPLASAAHAGAAVGEALGGRLFRARFRPAEPDSRGDRLDEATLRSCLPWFADDRSILPAYDDRSLQWLLGRAALMTREGRLEGVAVKNGRGELRGWYLYYARPDGVGEVLQIAATRQTISEVLRHLAYRAWRQGAMGVAGRLDPGFLDELLTGCFLSAGRGPWVLVHSNKRSLLHAIQRGDAFLSRLEGEWCLRLNV